MLIALLSTFAGWIGDAKAAQAAPDSCGLSVTIIAAPYAAVDSNKPGVEGPTYGYVGRPNRKHEWCCDQGCQRIVQQFRPHPPERQPDHVRAQ